MTGLVLQCDCITGMLTADRLLPFINRHCGNHKFTVAFGKELSNAVNSGKLSRDLAIVALRHATPLVYSASSLPRPNLPSLDPSVQHKNGYVPPKGDWRLTQDLTSLHLMLIDFGMTTELDLLVKKFDGKAL